MKFNDNDSYMKDLLLVVTYLFLLKSRKANVDKNLSLLYLGKNKRRIFTPRPMVWFLCTYKLQPKIVGVKELHTENILTSFCNVLLACQFCINNYIHNCLIDVLIFCYWICHGLESSDIKFSLKTQFRFIFTPTRSFKIT